MLSRVPWEPSASAALRLRATLECGVAATALQMVWLVWNLRIRYNVLVVCH